MDSRSLAREFESFIVDLFRAQGFHVQIEPITSSPLGQFRPDMIVNTGETSAVVEVKAWRSKNISMPQLVQMADQVTRYMAAFETQRGILTILGQLTDSQRQALGEFYPSLVIYDLGTLRFIVGFDVKLSERLESLVQEALPFSNNVESTAGSRDSIIGIPPRGSHVEPVTLSLGADLCAAIRAIPTGKATWRRYEQACLAALKYIFEDDLTGWHEQKRSETGISIYDTVCRVVSSHDLWQVVVNHFQSRYIIFEYKNYSQKIKQGQIYTTEKYLYRQALRSVAIIISRLGADANGLAASRGALREHGKLILNLTVDDLCEMLHLKDDNGDVNGILLTKLDDILLKIER